MMTRFSVKNYKALKDVDIPLTPIHVIIGENDAGKTSLLEAMCAFFRSSERRMKDVFPGSWKGNELVFQGNKDGPVEFHAKWELRARQNGQPRLSGYGIRVAFPDETRNCIVREEFPGENRDQRGYSVNNESTIVCRRKDQPQSGGTEFSFVPDLLRSVHMYRFSPR